MATVKQYVTQIWDRQRVIGRKLGSDVGRVDKQTRVLVLSIDVIIAVIVKVLVDKGVVTDAELLAALDAARDDIYADEPTEPAAG